MSVVLDTNVLLVSITPKSIFYPTFDSFLREEYGLQRLLNLVSLPNEIE